jgi:ADP-heptose:LPS heptosyltransferase
MTIKILTNSGGVGLGNQVQMIPVIKHHLKIGNEVISDTDNYHQLGLRCEKSNKKYDIGYFTFAYRRNDMFREMIRRPFAKFEGYKWRFRDSFYGRRFIMPDFTKMTEKESNIYYWTDKEPYFLDGHRPYKNRVAIITSNKFIKRYNHWESLIDELIAKGKDVRVYGDMKDLPYYINTPTLREFFEELRRCEFYYSTDCGGMHLADILGIKGVVLWGESNIRQARPLNAETIRLLDQHKIYNTWLKQREGNYK